jgi:hypothetical protein
MNDTLSYQELAKWGEIELSTKNYNKERGILQNPFRNATRTVPTFTLAP